MAAPACNNTGFRQLLAEIKTKNLNELDKKMIEYLENLDYDEPITKNFGNMIIGRIIKENNLPENEIQTIANLKVCGDDVENCDNLLFQFVKKFKELASTIANQGLFVDAFNIYPNLSYHAKMRLQFIIYRLIYTSQIAEYNTVDNRRDFVKFFDKRCLNAQYRNILYQDEKYILDNIDNVQQQADFDGFMETLTKSIFNISADPTIFKSLKTDGTTELTISDFASFNAANKADLKAIFENKMKIMGGNKGVHMYHLCSSSVNISLKKVQAKTAREGAKIMARKLLNKSGNKSVKFSLKRMIGNKEKYYNYQASIDKSGKISIKST